MIFQGRGDILPIVLPNEGKHAVSRGLQRADGGGKSAAEPEPIPFPDGSGACPISQGSNEQARGRKRAGASRVEPRMLMQHPSRQMSGGCFFVGGLSDHVAAAYASLKTPHCGVFRAFGAPQTPFGRQLFHGVKFNGERRRDEEHEDSVQ